MSKRDPARAGAASDAAAKSSDVSVIARALDILALFEQGAGPLSMMSVVQRTGLHKATVFRLLATLVADDLLRHTPSGEYELGYFATKRADCLLHADPLWLAMRSEMEKLRDRLNETVVLTRRDGDETIDLDIATASAPVMQSPPIGRRIALHGSIAGQIILASECDAEREAYVHRAEQAYPATIVRDAIGRKEVASLAAAIHDRHGRPIGALWLAIPPGRHIDRRALQSALVEACRVQI